MASFQVLTIVAFIFLANHSIISACENSTIPTNYGKTNTTSTSTQTFKNYIKTSCTSTTYPSICYSTLSPYATKIEADPMKLCSVSLSLAYKAEKSSSSTISKLLKNKNMTGIAKQVVQDCFGDVKDSIGELKDSLDSMAHLNGTDRRFHISNIQTWVSASITNDQTCSDEFDEMSVDSSLTEKIRNAVLDAARKTSNALYFINNYVKY